MVLNRANIVYNCILSTGPLHELTHIFKKNKAMADPVYLLDCTVICCHALKPLIQPFIKKKKKSILQQVKHLVMVYDWN